MPVVPIPSTLASTLQDSLVVENMHSTTLGGLEIGWLESGAGDPMILLHGLAGDDPATYLPAMQHFNDWRCIAPWARGHGRSGWADSYLVEDFAADVVGLIEQVLEQRSTLIVGFSLGSVVGCYVAAHRPDLVRGLFLEDCGLQLLHDPLRYPKAPFVPFLQAFRDARTEMVEQDHGIGWLQKEVARFPYIGPGSEQTFGELFAPEALAMFAAMIAGSDPAVVGPMLTTPTAQQVAALPVANLAEINCPTFVIAGDPSLGGAQSADDLAEFKQLVPQAEVRRLNNVGHETRSTPESFDIYISELRRFAALV